MTALTSLGRMTLLLLRTGWLRLLVWWGVCVGLVVGSFAGVVGLYASEASRAAYAASVGRSAATAAFNGRGYDLLTLGGIGSYEAGFVVQVLLPIAAVLVAVSVTRAPEEAGLTEVLTAGRLGRLAPLLAGAIVTGVFALAVRLATAGGLVALGLPTQGALAYAGSIAALVCFFAAVGLVASELCQGARTARLLALAVFALALLARVAVDGAGLDATWASPLGWVAESRPWGQDSALWPPLTHLALAAALVGAAVILRLRRDLGAGLVAPRPGPARGRPGDAGIVRLAWRLTWVACAAWVVGVAVFTATFGVLAADMVSLIAANPEMLAALGVSDPTDLVTRLVGVLAASSAAACGVGVLVRLRGEEASGRLGVVLSGAVTRRMAWSGWVAVAAGQSLLVLGGALLAYGLGGVAAGQGLAQARVAATTGLASALPVLVVVAIAAALAAWVPPLTGIAYVPAAWIAVVGLLAETLRLPGWARSLSPVDALGDLTHDAPSPLALGVIAAIAVVLAVAALARADRRDLREG